MGLLEGAGVEVDAQELLRVDLVDLLVKVFELQPALDDALVVLEVGLELAAFDLFDLLLDILDLLACADGLVVFFFGSGVILGEKEIWLRVLEGRLIGDLRVLVELDRDERVILGELLLESRFFVGAYGVFFLLGVFHECIVAVF